MSNSGRIQAYTALFSAVVSVIALVISIAALYLTTSIEIPLAERQVELAENKTAQIVVDVIPSLGSIRENTYNTRTRPAKGDIGVDFYVLLWNVGNASAANVTVSFDAIPHVSSWFDFHWSVVTLEAFSYRPPSSRSPIKVLFPNQQAQVQFHVRFMPAGFDELLRQGTEPRIYVEVSTNDPEQILFGQEYTVSIP